MSVQKIYSLCRISFDFLFHCNHEHCCSSTSGQLYGHLTMMLVCSGVAVLLQILLKNGTRKSSLKALMS